MTDVRDQILKQATREFARTGFEATSLQRISDAVGIRKQSLLYHFASKDDLRAAVHAKMLDHWSDVLPRLLQAATSGEGQFDAVVTELVTFFTTDPDRARLVVREVLDRPEEIAGILASRVRPWVEIVCNYIRKGQAHGDIYADVDPEAYVVQVINLVIASVATHTSIGGIVSSTTGRVHDRHIRELVRVAKASLFKGDTWRTSSGTTKTSSTTSTKASTGPRSPRSRSSGSAGPTASRTSAKR
jgi:AcrR family transcriptional regulator